MPTLVGGDQINRNWKTSLGVGLSILAISAGALFISRVSPTIDPTAVHTQETYNHAGQLVYWCDGTGACHSSGTLTIRGSGTSLAMKGIGTISGTTLRADLAFYGAGATDCVDSVTSKLLYNSSTGRFSCGTDQTGGGSTPEVGTSSFSGGVLRLSDSRYVNTSGDTMTGALTIDLTSGFIGLKVLQTASGKTLHAEKTLTSSGTLVILGNANFRAILSGASLRIGGVGVHTFSGSLIAEAFSGSTFQGFQLRDCDTAGTSKLLWDVTTKKFSCGTDSDTTYKAGQGLTLTSTSFKISNIHSGSIIQASLTLASSGSLVWEGTGSGNRLHIVKTLSNSGGIISDSPNGISGSLIRAAEISPRIIVAQVFASGSTVTVGSGQLVFQVPRVMSGYKLGEINAAVLTNGVTNTFKLRVRNITKANRQMLTKELSIDSGEPSSDTAATPYTIAPNADVGAFDLLSFDVIAVHTTPPKGLIITFYFYKP